MKPIHLGIEAVVCAVPSFIVVPVGVLIFLYGGGSMLRYEPVEGVRGIAIAFGLIVSLLEYTRLAARTIVGERYEFGPLFWLGACFGLFGVWYAFSAFSLALGGAIAVPIVGASLHFIWLQFRQRREQVAPMPSNPSSQRTASGGR